MEYRKTVQAAQMASSSIGRDVTSSFAFMTGNYQSENENNKITLILDSGASDHLINTDKLFNSFVELQPP
ncbi:hypothetical protein KPH14_012974, partial [Odynerus spinipes]